MSSTTPGTLRGSSADGPTQAMRSSYVRMAALLRISDPVHSRPMFVSKRAVMGISSRAGNHGYRLQPS